MNGNEAVRTVTAALSTKDVVLWCRNHDYTPKKADQTWTHMQLPDYCKYCGERHYEDCARMAKRTVSSLTSSSDLLRLLPQGWDEDREAGNSSSISASYEVVLIYLLFPHWQTIWS